MKLVIFSIIPSLPGSEWMGMEVDGMQWFPHWSTLMWYMKHMLEFVACGCNLNKGCHKLCKQNRVNLYIHVYIYIFFILEIVVMVTTTVIYQYITSININVTCKCTFILKIQNGGHCTSQITCLHFLCDSNNNKLSMHTISCKYSHA